MGDLIKTQMLMGVGNIGTSAVKNYVIMNLYEKFVMNFPTWWPVIKSFICRRQRNTNPQSRNREIMSAIHCEKSSTSNPKNTSHTRMDSVINYVTTIPAIRHLICITSEYLPNEFESVMIENDIYFQLTDLKQTDGVVEQIKFKLFCYDHEVQHLQDFVERCNTAYERKQANKLGTSLYFFDQITASKSKKTLQNPIPNNYLIYTKHKFEVYRNFENVFFEDCDKVKNHVEFFLTQKEWYHKKGIPHTLGFMFHGEPGCGKTSAIKAISNVAHRHVINLQLSEIKTKQQLRHLFFNDELCVFNGQTTERYTIPVSERMFVVEDVDAMGDAVLRRELKQPVEPKQADNWDQIDEEFKEPIDLAFLLNLLDGTLEAPGRIIAFSSNHPERIDRALIRPGRVDMIIEFRKCNTTILHQMLESFYDKKFEPIVDQTLNYKWSPAEVNQILFRNFRNSEIALKELTELEPSKLSGIVEKESYAEFSAKEIQTRALTGLN